MTDGHTVWSNKLDKDRRRHISGYIVFTPALLSAIGVIEDLYESWREAPEGEISFIQGATRAGKTTAVDEFILDKHAVFVEQYEGMKGFQVLPLSDDPALWAIEIKTSEGWLRPLIKLPVSKKPKFSSLFADVLSRLGFPKIPDRMTSDQRLALMTTQFREQQTRVIVFDEVHHISEYKDQEGNYNAGDVFKIVAKTARTGVLCVGLPHMMDLVDANPQVREAVRTPHFIEPFTLDLRIDSDLMRFMAALNTRLPFDEISCLDDVEVVLRIAVMNDCYAGRIARFVYQLASYGIANGARCITQETIIEFLRIRKAVRDDANIFLISRDALSTYTAVVEKERRERILASERRRARASGRPIDKNEFGAFHQ